MIEKFLFSCLFIICLGSLTAEDGVTSQVTKLIAGKNVISLSKKSSSVEIYKDIGEHLRKIISIRYYDAAHQKWSVLLVEQLNVNSFNKIPAMAAFTIEAKENFEIDFIVTSKTTQYSSLNKGWNYIVFPSHNSADKEIKKVSDIRLAYKSDDCSVYHDKNGEKLNTDDILEQNKAYWVYYNGKRGGKISFDAKSDDKSGSSDEKNVEGQASSQGPSATTLDEKTDKEVDDHSAASSTISELNQKVYDEINVLAGSYFNKRYQTVLQNWIEKRKKDKEKQFDFFTFKYEFENKNLTPDNDYVIEGKMGKYLIYQIKVTDTAPNGTAKRGKGLLLKLSKGILLGVPVMISFNEVSDAKDTRVASIEVNRPTWIANDDAHYKKQKDNYIKTQSDPLAFEGYAFENIKYNKNSKGQIQNAIGVLVEIPENLSALIELPEQIAFYLDYKDGSFSAAYAMDESIPYVLVGKGESLVDLNGSVELMMIDASGKFIAGINADLKLDPGSDITEFKKEANYNLMWLPVGALELDDKYLPDEKDAKNGEALFQNTGLRLVRYLGNSSCASINWWLDKDKSLKSSVGSNQVWRVHCGAASSGVFDAYSKFNNKKTKSEFFAPTTWHKAEVIDQERFKLTCDKIIFLENFDWNGFVPEDNFFSIDLEGLYQYEYDKDHFVEFNEGKIYFTYRYDNSSKGQISLVGSGWSVIPDIEVEIDGKDLKAKSTWSPTFALLIEGETVNKDNNVQTGGKIYLEMNPAVVLGSDNLLDKEKRSSFSSVDKIFAALDGSFIALNGVVEMTVANQDKSDDLKDKGFTVALQTSYKRIFKAKKLESKVNGSLIEKRAKNIFSYGTSLEIALPGEFTPVLGLEWESSHTWVSTAKGMKVLAGTDQAFENTLSGSATVDLPKSVPVMGGKSLVSTLALALESSDGEWWDSEVTWVFKTPQNDDSDGLGNSGWQLSLDEIRVNLESDGPLKLSAGGTGLKAQMMKPLLNLKTAVKGSMTFSSLNAAVTISPPADGFFGTKDFKGGAINGNLFLEKDDDEWNMTIVADFMLEIGKSFRLTQLVIAKDNVVKKEGEFKFGGSCQILVKDSWMNGTFIFTKDEGEGSFTVLLDSIPLTDGWQFDYLTVNVKKVDGKWEMAFNGQASGSLAKMFNDDSFGDQRLSAGVAMTSGGQVSLQLQKLPLGAGKLFPKGIHVEGVEDIQIRWENLFKKPKEFMLTATVDILFYQLAKNRNDPDANVNSINDVDRSQCPKLSLTLSAENKAGSKISDNISLTIKNSVPWSFGGKKKDDYTFSFKEFMISRVEGVNTVSGSMSFAVRDDLWKLPEGLSLPKEYLLDFAYSKDKFFAGLAIDKELAFNSVVLKTRRFVISKASPWSVGFESDLILMDSTISGKMLLNSDGFFELQVESKNDGKPLTIPLPNKVDMEIKTIGLVLDPSSPSIKAELNLKTDKNSPARKILGPSIEGRLSVSKTEFEIAVKIEEKIELGLGKIGKAIIEIKELSISSKGDLKGVGSADLPGVPKVGFEVASQAGSVSMLFDVGEKGLVIDTGGIFKFRIKNKFGHKSFFGLQCLIIDDMELALNGGDAGGLAFNTKRFIYFLPIAVPPVGFPFFDELNGELEIVGFGVGLGLGFPAPDDEDAKAVIETIINAFVSGEIDFDKLSELKSPAVSIQGKMKIPNTPAFKKMFPVTELDFGKFELKAGDLFKSLGGVNVEDIFGKLVPVDKRKINIRVKFVGFDLKANIELRTGKFVREAEKVEKLNEISSFISNVNEANMATLPIPQAIIDASKAKNNQVRKEIKVVELKNGEASKVEWSTYDMGKEFTKMGQLKDLFEEELRRTPGVDGNVFDVISRLVKDSGEPLLVGKKFLFKTPEGGRITFECEDYDGAPISNIAGYQNKYYVRMGTVKVFKAENYKGVVRELDRGELIVRSSDIGSIKAENDGRYTLYYNLDWQKFNTGFDKKFTKPVLRKVMSLSAYKRRYYRYAPRRIPWWMRSWFRRMDRKISRRYRQYASKAQKSFDAAYKKAMATLAIKVQEAYLNSLKQEVSKVYASLSSESKASFSKYDGENFHLKLQNLEGVEHDDNFNSFKRIAIKDKKKVDFIQVYYPMDLKRITNWKIKGEFPSGIKFTYDNGCLTFDCGVDLQTGKAVKLLTLAEGSRMESAYLESLKVLEDYKGFYRGANKFKSYWDQLSSQIPRKMAADNAFQFYKDKGNPISLMPLKSEGKRITGTKVIGKTALTKWGQVTAYDHPNYKGQKVPLVDDLLDSRVSFGVRYNRSYKLSGGAVIDAYQEDKYRTHRYVHRWRGWKLPNHNDGWNRGWRPGTWVQWGPNTWQPAGDYTLGSSILPRRWSGKRPWWRNSGVMCSLNVYTGNRRNNEERKIAGYTIMSGGIWRRSRWHSFDFTIKKGQEKNIEFGVYDRWSHTHYQVYYHYLYRKVKARKNIITSSRSYIWSRSVKLFFNLKSETVSDWSLIHPINDLDSVAITNVDGKKSMSVNLFNTENKISYEEVEENKTSFILLDKDGYQFQPGKFIAFINDQPVEIKDANEAAEKIRMITKTVHYKDVKSKVTNTGGIDSYYKDVEIYLYGGKGSTGNLTKFELESKKKGELEFSFTSDNGFGNPINRNESPIEVYKIDKGVGSLPKGILLSTKSEPGGLFVDTRFKLGKSSIIKSDISIKGQIQTNGEFYLKGDGSLIVGGYQVSDVVLEVGSANGVYVRGFLKLYDRGIEIEGYLRPNGIFAFKGKLDLMVNGTGVKGALALSRSSNNAKIEIFGGAYLMGRKVINGTVLLDKNGFGFRYSMSAGIVGLNGNIKVGLKRVSAELKGGIWIRLDKNIYYWGVTKWGTKKIKTFWKTYRIRYPKRWGWKLAARIKIRYTRSLSEVKINENYARFKIFGKAGVEVGFKKAYIKPFW